MKLRELRIKNFRNLVDVHAPIADTTLLVGENNSGKTALLDALRIALPRTGYGRAHPFDEYDYHMAGPDESPQKSEGIVIELWFRETASGEWPDPIVQALTEIVQTDPVRDLNSIGLRLSSRYDAKAQQFTFVREFLNLQGEPLAGKAASPAMVTRFLDYVRLFYLSALRDSDTEFSPKSQFWGRILRDLKVDDAKRKELSNELKKLNQSLLSADPRLEQVRKSLEKIQGVVSAGGTASIQPLPMQPWDLMAKSQVVIRARGTEVDFPLSKHGQGIQSLAVLFLFQAYVDVLLKPTFQEETEAILALEEPEAHLHPQAIRALTGTISDIASQKIISTHSPYVLQGVPIQSVRLLRRVGSAVKILFVKRAFTTQLPSDPRLVAYCGNSNGKYDYHEGTLTLTVHGKMEKQEYRKLLPIFAADKQAQTALEMLATESQLYIPDSDLADLDTYAKRIRGEVFFARAWLLCEGQSDFLLLHYFAELLDSPLDQFGVTVIDFQNNGSPGAFVALARSVEVPWLMVCDSDDAGKQYEQTVKDKGLTAKEAQDCIRPLPAADQDLELFLVQNGFLQDYEAILAEKGVALTVNPGDPGYEEEVAEALRKRKTDFANELIRRLRDAGADATRVPQFFAQAIADVVAKAD